MEIKNVMVEENICDIFDPLYVGSLAEELKRDTLILGAYAALDDGSCTAAGLLIAEINDNMLFIKWLYVHHDYRNKRVGSGLVGMLAAWARQEGFEGLYTYYSDNDMGTFLNLIGFDNQISKAQEFETRIDEIIELPGVQKSANMMQLEDMPQVLLRKYNAEADVNDSKVYVSLPIVASDYLEESAVYMEGDEVNSIMLMKETGRNINISYAYVKKGKEPILIRLISYVKAQLLEKYPANRGISVAAINPQSVQLTRKLFPHAIAKSVYEAYMPLN